MPLLEPGLRAAMEYVDRGEVRVDPNAGLVYRTYATSLYSYERPIGRQTAQGYVAINFGRSSPQVFAHRLIWLVATGEIPADPLVVNHINGVKHDNRLSNLELVSQSRNISHAYETGLMPRGEQHYAARLTDEQVRRVLALSFSESASVGEVAERFNVSHSLVSMIWSGSRRCAGATP